MRNVTFDKSFHRHISKIDVFQSYYDIIKAIIDDLEIDDAEILFNVLGSEQSASVSVLGQNKFRISFKPYYFENDDEFKFIVAHELRHVWQYQHKILGDSILSANFASIYLWKDIMHVKFEYDPFGCKNLQERYKDLPWELDANIYAKNWVGETDNYTNYFWGMICKENSESVDKKCDRFESQCTKIPLPEEFDLNFFKSIFLDAGISVKG